MIKLHINPDAPLYYSKVHLVCSFDEVQVWCNGVLLICNERSYVCLMTQSGKFVWWFVGNNDPAHEFRID